jgi:hypothetical protein
MQSLSIFRARDSLDSKQLKTKGKGKPDCPCAMPDLIDLGIIAELSVGGREIIPN